MFLLFIAIILVIISSKILSPLSGFEVLCRSLSDPRSSNYPFISLCFFIFISPSISLFPFISILISIFLF